ncbi:MAG: cobalamin-binding protein [Bacteroidetes bacterium]|nr:cobalamin-binding protein [Bacteroidota bacterium]
MNNIISLHDKIGIVKPYFDAHVLGVSVIKELLAECGFTVIVANDEVSKAVADSQNLSNSSLIRDWIRKNTIQALGFSYRLNVDDAILMFRKLMYQLESHRMLVEDGGKLKSIWFAGLPEACNKIKYLYKNVIVFYGDESFSDSLKMLGLDFSKAPQEFKDESTYKNTLDSFGKEVVDKGDYLSTLPVDRSGYKNFGTAYDSLIDRIRYTGEKNLLPVTRAHAGPYLENRHESVKQFIEWSRLLAHSGYLDVLSIGTSQLTQAKFGERWDDLYNGGGVGINSPEEYERIYEAAKPMLVRTYSGTKNLRKQAEIHEKSLNIAWHALSLWWFSKIDGRGELNLLDNLTEHFEAIAYIAKTGKPYEANVAHQFAFRSSDDISYIVSVFLAAKAAKKLGIKHFILQIMLNDPKHTSAINDLAKARATLNMVRSLEDSNFKVFLQTRAGLSYLSHDIDKAKKQLASVTALMDDIEPFNHQSPDIIHVVSFSEGNDLATPEVIDESIKITLYSLNTYREYRKKGWVDNMAANPDVDTRMLHLINEAKIVIKTIENTINDTYTPQGFYDIFKLGFLPVPQLLYCREEFPEAIKWNTKLRHGGVDIYLDDKKILAKDRMNYIIDNKEQQGK